MRFIRQSQWATNKGIAECVEQVDFGIVGAVIDETGEGYLLEYLIAAPEIIDALRACLPDLEHYAATHGPGPDRRLAAARAALAKVAHLA